MDKLKVNIRGRHIENFINRLIKLNIELIDIEYVSYQEINIIIYKKDYKLIKKNKTIYEIKIIQRIGVINVLEKIKNNKIILIFILLGFIILLLLSKMIFSVKVVHNNEDLRNLLYQELKEHDIKKYSFKKNRSQLEKIKQNVLKEYKDKIEWLEIENIGTSYIIRVEERIIPKTDSDIMPRSIVAKKNAVIKSIKAKTGNVERLRGEYVKQGDVIINGNIIFNDEIKGLVKAEGSVYGEVWYTLEITYPYVYQEEKYTNNMTTNLSFKFLNKNYIIFGKKFKYKDTISKKILSLNFLPIYLSIEKNKEKEKIDYVLTCDQAYNKALEKGQKQIESKLGDDEYLISSNVLSSSCEVDKVVLNVFYTVYENITDYQIIN